MLPDDLSDDAVLASALAVAAWLGRRSSAPATNWSAEAAAARAQLAGLPDVAARGALEALCDYVVTRTG